MNILLLNYRNVPFPSFFTDYLAGIAEAAAELGHATATFDYERIGEVVPAEREALYRALAETQPDAVIDLCGWGYALSQLRVWDGSGEGEAVFDASDAACVALLCDQPYYQPLAGVHAKRLAFAVPDRSHREQIAMIHPELAAVPVEFVPPAARAANDRGRPWRERDIELLYFGNLQLAALKKLWRGAPEEERCEALAERAIAAPHVPLHAHLAAMLGEDGIEADAAQRSAWLQRVEYYLRARFRLDAVRAAAKAGMALRIVGQGWDSLSWPDTVTLQNNAGYDEMFSLAGRARAALDASTYHNGANDRVFNYALNGCLTFTNADGYLGDAFAGVGVRCYSPRELDALAPSIREALAQPERAREEAEAARTLVLREHHWRSRLQTMLDAL